MQREGKREGNALFPAKSTEVDCGADFPYLGQIYNTSKVRSFQSMIVEPFGTKWEKSKSYSMHSEQ